MKTHLTKSTFASTRALLANEDSDAFTNALIGNGACHKAELKGRFKIESLLKNSSGQLVYSYYRVSKTAQRLSQFQTHTKLGDKQKSFLEIYHSDSSSKKSTSYFNLLDTKGEATESLIIDVFILLFEDGDDKTTVKFDLRGSFSYLATFVSNRPRHLVERMNFITENFYIGGLEEPSRERPMINIVSKQSDGNLNLNRIPLRENRVMEKDKLVAHYGESILSLQDELTASLKTDQCGLHLFQGAPGMGKTSYINHLCGELAGLHMVIYVPNASFEELVDPQNMHFWLDLVEDMEEGQKLLLVVEDAESLLFSRDSYDSNRSAVSSLLNLCDGLMGQVLGLHLLATANTNLENIDSAILRAGRLKTHHVFNRLESNEAQRLARFLKKEVEIDEGKNYSIAEVYHGESVHEEVQQSNKLGFHT